MLLVRRRSNSSVSRDCLTASYTLSRGTSSASWVLLQSPNYLTNVKLWSCASFVAHLLLYLKDHFLSTSFLSFLFFYFLCEFRCEIMRMHDFCASRSGYWLRSEQLLFSFARIVSSILLFTSAAISVDFISLYSSYSMGFRKCTWTFSIFAEPVSNAL